MKTTLWATLSADGFLAREDDSTPWSDEDCSEFQKFVKSQDAVLVGRKAYEIMKTDDDFVGGVEFIVVTSSNNLDTGEYKKLSIESLTDLPEVEKLGVIGGGDLNGRLMKLGAIDELIIDIEPLIFGKGKRMFGDHESNYKLDLLKSRRIAENLVQNYYRVSA